MSKNLGTLVRSARVAHGWTQRDLADHLHCSRSTVSRLETGAQPLGDIATLRRLAKVLQISPTALGITATVTVQPLAEDDVRRRQLLTNLAVTAAAASPPARAIASAAADAQGRPKDLLVTRVRSAMLTTGSATAPIPPTPLRATLASAIRAYDNCEYTKLATALPQLITNAHATCSTTDTVLAETYTLVTRLMIKLDDQLGWVAADRARSLATACGDPLVAGEAARNLAVLARRAGWHSEAEQIAIGMAEDDMLQGRDSARTAERGLLVMSAAYTAAHAADHSGMRQLTEQAAALAAHLGGKVLLRDHGSGFSPTAVQLHRISAEYAAGDPAAAIAAARKIPPRALPTVERRARYFTDVARAYGMWGRRDQCLQALLHAERAAPQETHSRPAVRGLVTGLLTSGQTSPDLRGLAARCGIR
ncbi:XRE family transcriptional regulator [Actinomadura darangshiensis]|uniref:XRE family transcriptional regulator n=1 Tax=Actinomadura darangshiensis TaxID=705336 RepID=A0A4R5BVC7_9ACTN|nr:helix-turn-helix transcriptional regulator [Actinomadura darangshiensis]TDD89533.1 XRE family transcriptional regulator [Actinomadura darangshiensis]